MGGKGGWRSSRRAGACWDNLWEREQLERSSGARARRDGRPRKDWTSQTVRPLLDQGNVVLALPRVRSPAQAHPPHTSRPGEAMERKGCTFSRNAYGVRWPILVTGEVMLHTALPLQEHSSPGWTAPSPKPRPEEACPLHLVYTVSTLLPQRHTAAPKNHAAGPNPPPPPDASADGGRLVTASAVAP